VVEEQPLSSKTESDYLAYIVRFELHARKVQKEQISPGVPPTWALICSFLKSLTRASACGARAALKFMFKR